jgi:two-component system nitrogen regulation sensor histidine kinase NtrY
MSGLKTEDSRLRVVKNYLRHNFPLIIALLSWILLSLIVINLVNQIFTKSDTSALNQQKFMLLLLVAGSLVLLVGIAVYLLRLLVSLLRRDFGSRIRFKITLFFVFVALLPIIPFIQIGSRFIEASMSLWYSRDIGEALDLSEEVIGDYYNEKVDTLMGASSQLEGVLQRSRGRLSAVELFRSQSGHRELLVSIWDSDGRLLREWGESLFGPVDQDAELNEAVLVEMNAVRGSVFDIEKGGKVYLVLPITCNSSATNPYFVNLSLPVSRYLLRATREIDSALRHYNTTSLFKALFSRGYNMLFFAVLLPIIIVVLMISLFLTRELLKPVQILFDATQRVAEGDYTFQIEAGFTDEFAVLAKSFNTMIAELGVSRERLQQKEKVGAWKEIAKRLAHEIKNPLTPIRLSTERILKKYRETSPDFEAVLEKGVKTIIREVESMSRLLTDFSQLASWPSLQLEMGGVMEILSGIVELLGGSDTGVKINLHAEAFDDPVFLRDEVQIKSVFMNIVKNSIESMDSGGRIDIYVDLKRVGLREVVEVVIDDEGTGVPPGTNIFEPYFSTKSYGSGLGLTIAQRVVHEHDGRIYFHSQSGEGTRFFVELPLRTRIQEGLG